MIQIRFETTETGLIRTMTMTGHANAGPYGQDLVCAGVSAVALSSLNAIDLLYPDACTMMAENNKIFLKVDHDSHDLQITLKTMATQLSALASEYPKSIRIRYSN